MVALEFKPIGIMPLSLASAAGLLRPPRGLAAEGPPDTATVRFVQNPVICIAPQYAAEELLRAEGFTDVSYVETTTAGAYRRRSPAVKPIFRWALR
jgi:hypothetical protein